MKAYRVVGGTIQVGTAEILAISAAQFASRGHALERVDIEGVAKDAPVVVARPLSILQFKSGEVLGIADAPKSISNLLTDFSPEKGNKADKSFADGFKPIRAHFEELALQAQLEAEAADREALVTEWNGSEDLKKEFSDVDAFIASRAGK